MTEYKLLGQQSFLPAVVVVVVVDFGCCLVCWVFVPADSRSHTMMNRNGHCDVQGSCQHPMIAIAIITLKKERSLRQKIGRIYSFVSEYWWSHRNYRFVDRRFGGLEKEGSCFLTDSRELLIARERERERKKRWWRLGKSQRSHSFTCLGGPSPADRSGFSNPSKTPFSVLFFFFFLSFFFAPLICFGRLSLSFINMKHFEFDI